MKETIILCIGLAIGALAGLAVHPASVHASSGYLRVNVQEVNKSTSSVTGYRVLGFSCTPESCYVLTDRSYH